jgi:hypothetical protein
MIHHNIALALALACLALLGVIAAQDWLYKPLRNETISAGLTGPYHALLDASYVPLAAALWFAFDGHPLMRLFGTIAGAALLLVALTNTAWRLVDRFTAGGHALWHSRFTLLVFTSALALQLAGDHGWLWWLTAANVAIPGACYAWFHWRRTDIAGTIIAASPAAEKLYVLGLCSWLIVWGLR